MEIKEVRCDNCNIKINDNKQLYDTYEVKSNNIYLLHMNNKWDFCSKQCLKEFINKKLK